MNAITMKLENKQTIVPSSKTKGKDSVTGKKPKNLRKKSIVNTDKDASLSDHGLGRKSSDINFDFNDSKSSNSVEHGSTKKLRCKKICTKNNDKMLTTSKTMHERLQQILSPSAKDKISTILNEVKTLSDVEKLFLYLQLPTGSPFEVDPFKIRNQNPLGKKADDEGLIAVTWIQSHLEEDPEVSLPKQEVYDEYQSYCQMTGTDALCAADFGKVMKQIFPSVKPRRLGTRGNSRYCYSGLRKKLNLTPPSLPDINTDTESCDEPTENIKDEVTSAACHILFEWAEKLLGFKFTSLKELASHLLENMYVDNRSVAAFTVLLEGSPQLLEKGYSNCEGGVKKSEAQVHLQRKIQEKELIKEQKKKLQEQRSNFTATSKSKLSVPKKKSAKSRKSKVLSEKSEENEIELILSSSVKENSLTSSSESLSRQVEKNLSEMSVKEEDMDLELIVDMELAMNDTPTSSNSNSELSLSKPATSDLYSENSIKVEDTSVKNTKIMIPRSKTPVCISQSLPGIIIVPSLPQMADISKQTSPKYKKIQPKPLKGDSVSAMARSRAGSLGSTSINKPKSKTNDGRHSSHAWLQSSSPESNDFNFVKNNTSKTGLLSSSQKSLKKNCFIVPKEKTCDKPKEDLQFTVENQSSSAFKDVKFQANSGLSRMPIGSSSSSTFKSNPLGKSSLPSKECNALKRPLDESRSTLKSKKLMLDSKFSDVMGSSFQDLSSLVKVTNVPSRRASVQQNAAAEEVNIHEIEGDALNDYYRGQNCQTLLSTSMQQNQENDLNLKRKKEDFNKDISQLRMLLEQKISCSQSNPSLLNSLKDISKSDLSLHLNQKDSFFYSNDINVVEGKLTAEQEQADKINLNMCSLSFEDEKQIKNYSQLETIEKFLDSHLASQDQMNETNELISDANIYLANSKTNFQQIDVDLPDLQQNLMNSNSDLLSSGLIDSLEYGTSQINNTALPVRVNTYTQVPSVPQSPNTRRRAFNFMPISPSHTPIPDSCVSGTSAVSSPIPNQYPRNMMSIGVGPSQPPSNAGSPFVSPRSTPVSTCRSRHSSGQSTSRHTPFQNFDSGVSSVSSSPFISPQPTPVPVSRLRHNSSHSSNKTVTFCSVNSPHIINSLSTVNSTGQIRSRHNSGPGVQHLSGNLNTRTNPLSPLVTEPGAQSSFVFPPGNELRYRHNSDSNTTSLSPVSEQTSSSSSCTSNLPDLTSVNDLALSQSFLNDSAADLLISGNSSNFKQVRQRHASSSVIYSKSYLAAKDPFSPEIQNLLKNEQLSGASNNQLSNRSQSVPLHQMLQNLNNYYFLNAPIEEVSTKSHPTTPVLNQAFSFPLLNTNQESALLSAELLNSEKSFNQTWAGLEGTGDLEVSNARRNLAGLLDPPLSDDLQTTLEDLRDCDNDFSKFAQELELSPNEDGNL